MALYSLTGWVRKDGRDLSFDSKWFSTQAIRQKYNAHVLNVCFGEIFIRLRVKGCKWISA